MNRARTFVLMPMRLVCVLLVVALAGCSDGGPVGDEDGMAASMGASGTSSMDPTVPPAIATPVTVPLDWEGTLVLGAWACEFTVTQQCQWQPEGAFGQSHAFEGLVGNVTGGELRVEWTATSPLTQELVLDAGVYTPDCADCNHTMLGSLAGPSPLVLPLPVGLRLAVGEVLGIGVYSNQYTSSDQGAAGTSGDQDFLVSGEITLQ